MSMVINKGRERGSGNIRISEKHRKMKYRWGEKREGGYRTKRERYPAPSGSRRTRVDSPGTNLACPLGPSRVSKYLLAK